MAPRALRPCRTGGGPGSADRRHAPTPVGPEAAPPVIRRCRGSRSRGRRAVADGSCGRRSRGGLGLGLSRRRGSGRRSLLGPHTSLASRADARLLHCRSGPAPPAVYAAGRLGAGAVSAVLSSRQSAAHPRFPGRPCGFRGGCGGYCVEPDQAAGPGQALRLKKRPSRR